MRRMLLPLLIALPVLAGCALSTEEAERLQAREAQDAERVAEILKGRVPGEPLSCLSPRQVNRSESFPGTILYTQGRTIYRNDLIGECAGLRADDIPVTRSPGGQLCRGDIITTVQRVTGQVTGGCALGAFVPYRLPESAR